LKTLSTLTLGPYTGNTQPIKANVRIQPSSTE